MHPVNLAPGSRLVVIAGASDPLDPIRPPFAPAPALPAATAMPRLPPPRHPGSICNSIASSSEP